jgi:phosphopentomutase/2,3-bisphosphoglycerate-independent phosphoglycerate mutase family metalloenzyme
MTEPSMRLLPAERRRVILLILIMLLPLCLSALFTAFARPGATSGDSGEASPKSAPSVGDGRLVVVILDSLRREAVDTVMPNLQALAQDRASTYVDVHTASGNMSLPNIQTLLEGRESPYASAIRDFTGARGSNNGLPAAAARAGLHPALIGDFIILGLYGKYGTIAVNRSELARSDLACDLAEIDKAIDVLSKKDVRLIILHVVGTDSVAHRWHPGHPEYERHYRTVDAKLSELIHKLDLKSDHLIVTGDHGHNGRGNHTPWSVAIFAGGTYPQLFSALGPLSPLQQVDMLFFMAFPHNLPLPVDYEGRYFGIDTPVNAAAATPEIQRRMEIFRSVQAETLQVSPENLPSAIAQKRAQARRALLASFQRALPLLILFLGWVTVAFRVNDSSSRSICPLFAIAILAIALWLCATPGVSALLAFLVAAFLFAWAIKAREFHRLCFLSLLLVGAAFTAFNPERTQWIVWRYPVVVFAAAGTVIVLLHERSLHGWPVAFCAVAMFVLPDAGFKTELGPDILNAWLLGAAVVLLALIVTRRFRQIRLTSGAWVDVSILLVAAKLLRAQRQNIGRIHNVLLDWFRHSAAGPAASAILYLGCASYLIWAVRRPPARIMLAATILILPIYSCWFAKLPLATLAVASIVPVFFAAWTSVFDLPGPLKDESDLSAERSGLLLAATLMMTFWILFQGFFIQEIDFSFALRYLPEKTTELKEFVFAFPLTLLKYALPLVLVILGYVGFRGLLTASRAIITALIFCNLKLAAILVQIFFGRLGTQQKFYELAMSDFVFVSQLELIAALTFLGLVLCAPGRRQALARETYAIRRP